ncbi:MAG: ABC transporter ATP-binding protein [Demequinaceae bacterium]|nr:ABC transporter ATP-binding protein [Demequinaceae bacterium]
MEKFDGPAISVAGLRVIRGKNLVIPDLSLEVPRGALVGLLGPSGSGKSTLMRSIVGSQIIAGGDITVLGLPGGTAPLRHRVGYVTQAPSVYMDLSARENLRYFASLVNAPKTDPQRVLDTVGLADCADRPVTTLSGGQLTRVSLAVALVGKPEVLILDEPTVGLDPILRRNLWAMFRRLAKEGATLMVSSHVMDEATRCDRLLIMRGGGILFDGTLSELLKQTKAKDADDAFLALADAADAREAAA